MHELPIAESIVGMVRDCAEGHQVTVVRVRLGRRLGVQPDTLKFCFELATSGTPLEGALLDISRRPGRELMVRSVEVAGADARATSAAGRRALRRSLRAR